MSINHYSSELPEPHWWSHRHYTMDHSPPATATATTANTSSSSNYHQPCTSSSHNSSATAFCLASHTLYRSFDLNNEDDDDFSDERAASTPEMPKDQLFEKALTPSDVGKLNRLVIPKQHAEKHFPLNATADSGENGLLLGFEDELGKSWRFRYSYWNSSQSYVLTKGWSRFVKEKRLESGDIIVFARHRLDTGRLFIGWRRRSSDGGAAQPVASGGGGGWNRVIYPGRPYPIQQQPPSISLHFQSEGIHAGNYQNQTSSAGSGSSKTLRLFGVNLECQAEESESSTPTGSPMSSHQQQQHHNYHQYQQYYSNNNHMDINFNSGGGDVDRQG